MAALLLPATARAASSTWQGTAGSTWTLTNLNQWVGGIEANGTDFAAIFNTNIGPFTTTAVDTLRTIGNMTIADSAGGDLWVFSSYLNGSLLLDVTAGSPTITATSPVLFNVALTGSDGLTKAGASVMTLAAPATYSGSTTVSAGTLRLGVDNALPTGTALVMAGSTLLDLNSTRNSQTLGSLHSTGTATVTLGPGTLAVGGDNSNTTFSGPILAGTSTIGGGIGNLTKTGTGTMTLTGVNTYSGMTTVNGGRLALSTTGNMSALSGLSVNAGGAFDISGITAASLNIASLEGTGAGTVSLGAKLLTLGNVNAHAPDTTFAGIIEGTGSLTKSGRGTLTLTGNNTYGGMTFVTSNGGGGGLVLATSNALSSASTGSMSGATTYWTLNSSVTQTLANFSPTSGNLVLNSGSALSITGGPTAFTLTTLQGSGALTIGGTFSPIMPQVGGYTGTVTINGSFNTNAARLAFKDADVVMNGSHGGDLSGTVMYGSLGGTGSFTLGSGPAFQAGFNNKSSTWSGKFNGNNGSFTKVGTGTMTLANTVAHTPGTITFHIYGGVVLLDGPLTDLTMPFPLTVGDREGTDTVRLGQADEMAGIGITLNRSGVFDLNGFNESIVALNPGATANGMVTTASSATLTLTNQTAGILAVNFDGPINLVKGGTNAVTFAADNTAMTGSVTINGGTSTITMTNALGVGSATFAASLTTVITGNNTTGPTTLGNSAISLNNATLLNLLGNNAITGTVNLTGAGITTINSSDTFGTLTLSGPITGGSANGLTKSGAGTLVLSGAGSTYSGVTNVSAGTLIVEDSSALGTTTGTTSIATASTLALRGGITLGDNIGFASGGSNVILNLDGANTLTGTVTLFNGGGNQQINALAGTLSLTGTTAVTVAGATTITFNAAGDSLINVTGNIASPVSTLTKNGTGTLDLSANNTFTGNVTVGHSGGELRVSGASGAINTANNPSLAVNSGGSFTLDNSAAVNTNRFGTGGISLSGGSLLFIGNDTTSSSETLGALTAITGAGFVRLATGTGAPAQLNFTSLSAGANNAPVVFEDTTGTLTLGAAGNNPRVIFSGPPTLTNGVLGYAVVKDSLGYNFATSSAGVGTISAFTGYTAGFDGSSTENAQITANTTLGAAQTANTLHLKPASGGQSLDLSGNLLTIGTGGVVLEGSDDFTISSGTGSITATTDMFIFVDQAKLTVDAVLPAGVARMTKVGGGTLTLSNSSNAIATLINVSQGVLEVTANGALGAPGSGVTILDNGSVLLSNVNYTNASPSLNLNGWGANGQGSLQATGTAVYGGTIGVGANGGSIRIATSGDSLSLTNTLSGSGALTKSGSGTLILSAVNTFTGPINVNEGTLVSTANAGLGGAAGTATATIASAATLKLQGVTITNSRPLALNGNGVGGTDGALMVTGATTWNNSSNITLSTDATINIPGGTDSFTMSSGALNGMGGFTKTGSGTLTFATGTNHTYEGATTVAAGILRYTGVGTLPLGTQLTVGTTATPATLDINALSPTVGTLSGSTAGTITNSSVTARTLSVTSDNTNTTYSGAIINGGAAIALSKNGTGTLTLAGSASTYTGQTSINQGALRVTGGGGVGNTSVVSLADVNGAVFDVQASETVGAVIGGGNLGGTVNVANGVTLTFGDASSRNYSGALTGSGALTKVGSGALTLGMIDDTGFTGPFNLTLGSLSFGNSLIGSWVLANSAVEMTGGSIGITGIKAVEYHLASLHGSAGSIGGGAGGGTLVVGSNNLSTTFSGTFTSESAVRKEGTGTMTLAGTGSNSNTGGFIVRGGEIILAKTTAASSSATPFLIGGGSGTAKVTLAGTTQFNTSSSITIENNGTFDVNGFTHSAGFVVGDAGASLIIPTASTFSTNTSSNPTNPVWGGVISGGGWYFHNNQATGPIIWTGVNTLSGTFTLGSSATLRFGVDNAMNSTTLRVILGTANLGAVTLDLNGFDATIGSIENQNSGGTVNTGNGGILTIAGSLNSTYANIISGSGGINKTGTSTLTLTANNTYTGPTSVSGGGLLIYTTTVSNEALSDAALVTVSGAGTELRISGISSITERIGGLAGTGTGTLALGAKNLIIGNTNNLSATFAGAITTTVATNTITKEGTGVQAMTGSSSLSNTFTINAGTLAFDKEAALGGSAGRVVINAATLRADDTFTAIKPMTLGHATSTIEVVPAETLTLSTTFTNPLADSGLTKTGTGTLDLTANNNYGGKTRVNQGTLLINGTTTGQGAYNVDSGATLGGSGTIGLAGGTGTVTVHSGGFLSPGNSPGILTISGNLLLEPGSTFFIELNGITAGTQHDRVAVLGGVTITDSNLTGTVGYAPTAGDALFIIDNNAADPVVGTFNGAANNSIVSIGGYQWRITYDADLGTLDPTSGTGNDVVLTNVVPILTTTPANGGTVFFANVRAGSSLGSTGTISATNTGDGTLTGSFPAAVGDFTPMGTLAFSAPPTASQTYSYTPATRGADTNLVTVTSDGGNSTLTFDGLGVGPVFASSISPDPSSPNALSDGITDHNFGSVNSGLLATTDLFFTLSNITPDGPLGMLTDLSLLSFTFTGLDASYFSFISVSAGGSVLSFGEAAATVTIRYTGDGTTGPKLATLNIGTDQHADFGGSGDVFRFDIEVDAQANVGVVPEPATVSLLALASLAMLRRRRRAA